MLYEVITEQGNSRWTRDFGQVGGSKYYESLENSQRKTGVITSYSIHYTKLYEFFFPSKRLSINTCRHFSGNSLIDWKIKASISENSSASKSNESRTSLLIFVSMSCKCLSSYLLTTFLCRIKFKQLDLANVYKNDLTPLEDWILERFIQRLIKASCARLAALSWSERNRITSYNVCYTKLLRRLISAITYILMFFIFMIS